MPLSKELNTMFNSRTLMENKKVYITTYQITVSLYSHSKALGI